jgi:hypothetical protein
MRFEGWVPNATANLSFSAVGDSINRNAVVRENFGLSPSRWVVCGQLRSNNDIQLPAAIVSVLERQSGAVPRGATRWHGLIYILTCRSVPAGGDTEGALDGQISIALPQGTQARAALGMVREAATLLRSAKMAAQRGITIRPPTTQQWSATQDGIARSSLFTCNFRLLRNGKTFFDVQNATNIDAVQTEWAVSQCYYFLKDTVHQHYHHRYTTDAIIELTREGSDPDWRNKTLRSLYRKVIQLRRYFNENNLSDSLGILAYAECFREIFADSDFGYDGTRRATSALPLYTKALRESISIRQDGYKRFIDRRKTDAQFIIGSVLTIVVLLVTVYAAADAKTTFKHSGNSLVELIGSKPYLAAIPFMLAYFAYRRYVDQSDGRQPLIRWLYRMFAWMPKEVMVVLGILTATLVGASGLYLILLATHAR